MWLFASFTFLIVLGISPFWWDLINLVSTFICGSLPLCFMFLPLQLLPLPFLPSPSPVLFNSCSPILLFVSPYLSVSVHFFLVLSTSNRLLTGVKAGWWDLSGPLWWCIFRREVILMVIMVVWFSLSHFHFLFPGIGYALAKEFLKAGDNVLICSRSG